MIQPCHTVGDTHSSHVHARGHMQRPVPVLFILYHSIVFQAQRPCTCACAMYSNERFVRRLLHCYNSGHLLGSTTHSAYIIPLFFICLYVFVCVQPAVLGGGGWEYILPQCLQRATRFRILYMQVFYQITMIVRSNQRGY